MALALDLEGVLVVPAGAAEVGHRAAEFELHLAVGQTVAQRLEAGDGHAELLARVHVVRGDGHQLVHQAHGFGALRGDAHVHRVLQASRSLMTMEAAQKHLLIS